MSIRHNKNKMKIMENFNFTHYWVSGFGWEDTIYSPEDFQTVEILGENKKDGTVFICINDKGGQQILKGTK